MNNSQKKIDRLVESILNEEVEKKVNSIMEQLKGNQSKLDVATPKGKLTAADFKKLRSTKKTETNEGNEMCENCGGGMYEGECMECGSSYMKEDWDEEMEDMETDEPQKDDSFTDSFISHFVHHDKPGKMSDFFKEGPMVDYIKNKKNKIFGKKETDEEVEEGNAFSGALNKARKQHKDSFEVDGETYPVREAKENWIQKAKMNKGALRKKLGIPEEDKIPTAKLKSLKKELEGKSKGDKKLSAADLKLLKQVNLALNLKSIKENNNLTLTENELINMVEGIVLEQKKKKEEDIKVSKVVNKVKDTISKKYTSGLAKTEKVLGKSKKENDDYIASVTKKMKEYLKDGSEETYESNPTKFPQGNGQTKKDDIKAYHASDAVDEYIEAFAYPGMTNLVYDEIKPDDENIDMYLKGNSKTGNAVVDKDGKALGNVVPSKTGERFKKNYDDNLYGVEQMTASYKRYPQPVDVAGEKKGSGTLSSKAGKAQKVINKVEESEVKKERIISEDVSKMKNLISYNRKTQ
jgi:hypothetical protein